MSVYVCPRCGTKVDDAVPKRVAVCEGPDHNHARTQMLSPDELEARR